MPRQYLGATPRRWVEYLAAILIGNAIYYLSLSPHLPGLASASGLPDGLGSHGRFLLVCVAVYGLIRLGASPSALNSRPGQFGRNNPIAPLVALLYSL